MFDDSSGSVNPKTVAGLPPIMRSIGIAEVSLVVANSGRVAVSNQVALEQNIAEISTKPDQGDEYRGVVEIDHEIAASEQQIIDSSEHIPSSEDSTETVKHSYVGESLISETKDNPYPNDSPLLGSN